MWHERMQLIAFDICHVTFFYLSNSNITFFQKDASQTTEWLEQVFQLENDM